MYSGKTYKPKRKLSKREMLYCLLKMELSLLEGEVRGREMRQNYSELVREARVRLGGAKRANLSDGLEGMEEPAAGERGRGGRRALDLTGCAGALDPVEDGNVVWGVGEGSDGS